MNTAPVKSFDSTTGVRLAEANKPSSKVLRLPDSEPLRLACDQLLAPIAIAYETYGTLNNAKSNAILVCHALTGDQYVASEHPVTKKPGWWETLVGPGNTVLAAGTWTVWVKVTDSPEIPVLQAPGVLTIY